MAERNAGIAPDKRLDFRIGVNLGDIIIDDDDIFGDGVNVAARLQTLAEPGGICVSKVVRDQALDKLRFAFEDLGGTGSRFQEHCQHGRLEVYRIRDEATGGSNAHTGGATPRGRASSAEGFVQSGMGGRQGRSH